MSDMIERVAKAIMAAMADHPATKVRANGPNGEAALKLFFELLAVEAIKAMREPTEEMKAVEGVHWDYSCHVCGGLKEGWQVMIDAALDNPSQITPHKAGS
jgi:hypothetical protein